MCLYDSYGCDDIEREEGCANSSSLMEGRTPTAVFYPNTSEPLDPRRKDIPGASMKTDVSALPSTHFLARHGGELAGTHRTRATIEAARYTFFWVKVARYTIFWLNDLAKAPQSKIVVYFFLLVLHHFSFFVVFASCISL